MSCIFVLCYPFIFGQSPEYKIFVDMFEHFWCSIDEITFLCSAVAFFEKIHLVVFVHIKPSFDQNGEEEINST